MHKLNITKLFYNALSVILLQVLYKKALNKNYVPLEPN